MKIAYIITRMDHYGGAQIHMRDLLVWMKDQGHAPLLISSNNGRIAEALQKYDIPFYTASSLTRKINPINDICAFFQIRRILKNTQPDIVSCHSSKAGFVGRMAAFSLGIPVLFTAHGWSFTNGVSWKKRIIYKFVEKIAAHFTTHIITVSEFDRRLASHNKIISPTHVTTIHNGSPWLPQSTTVPTNPIPQIVMIARFSPQKDHRTLVDALDIIKDSDWHVNFVGAGDDSAIRDVIQELGLENRFSFHDEIDAIHDFLMTQDIFVLSSHWEGFPRSIIEAMRAGLPVITSRTAGSVEAIVDSKSGFIVNEKSPQMMAEKIKMLLNDGELRQQMGQQGRISYEHSFTFNMMAEKTVTIYKNALATKHSTPAATPQPHRCSNY